MSFCVVFSWKNRHSRKNQEQLEMESARNQKISFHLFPQNMERRMKWLKVLQLENYKPLKSVAVCSAHFKEADYELNYTNRKLKKDAVPHLLEAEIQPVNQIYSDHQNISIEENINNKAEKNNEENIGNITEDIIEDITKGNITEDNMDTYHNNTQIVHRSTSITPDRILNSPIKAGMREAYT